MLERGRFLLFSHFSQEIPRAPTKGRRGGGSVIDVTSLATAVNASGCLFGDWPFATYSAPDWSDRGKNELHISAVDSILLQIRRSREREVGSSRPLLTPRKLERRRICGEI